MNKVEHTFTSLAIRQLSVGLKPTFCLVTSTHLKNKVIAQEMTGPLPWEMCLHLMKQTASQVWQPRGMGVTADE
jgi:hypothetical protein